VALYLHSATASSWRGTQLKKLGQLLLLISALCTGGGSTSRLWPLYLLRKEPGIHRI